MGYLMPKPTISPKVSVIVWLKFKPTYFHAIVQNFSHYALETTLDLE